MSRKKRVIRPVTIQPVDNGRLSRLNLFSLLKKDPTRQEFMSQGESVGIDTEQASDFLTDCVKKDLLQISGKEGKGSVAFSSGAKNILGIGFSGETANLVVIDIGGKIVGEEAIKISALKNFKGKNKEIKEIVEELGERTSMEKGKYLFAGLAVPETLMRKNGRAAELLGENAGRVFDSHLLITSETVAAGYGEKESGSGRAAEEFIYMHSDIGSGVVIKDETIYEAEEGSPEETKRYLRSWKQFDIVDTAKTLVSKGVGTDIVNRVKGDVDAISLEVVLQAAEESDELAEDLVKRSALALGVRTAYLVNIFSVPSVLLGGGVEGGRGRFLEYVKEGAARFLLEKHSEAFSLVPGALGGKASSFGAAALCRREIFMEV